MKFTHAKMADPQIYEELWKRSPIRYVDQVTSVLLCLKLKVHFGMVLIIISNFHYFVLLYYLFYDV